MEKKPKNWTIVLNFSPEQWSPLDRFTKFHRTTYSIEQPAEIALRGIGTHLSKANIFYGLAVAIAPRIIEDDKEVEANGYSPAIRSKEITSLVESVFCELYSSLDCMCRVLGGVFNNNRGVPKKSAHRFFDRAGRGNSVIDLPEGIRTALANASFYNSLEKIRTSITHYDGGTCCLDKSTGKIFYILPEPLKGERSDKLDDIFGYLCKLSQQIVQIYYNVFSELNKTLKDCETEQICCISYGRVYMRRVLPSEAVDFHSGTCDSYRWFEKPENPKCPFLGKCGAYSRAKQGSPH